MATRDTYTKQEWENLPAETTPVSAERLSHIEQGIKDASDKRALKEIYDDAGINTGMQNTISSVNGYMVNGNGNTVQNGADVLVNGDGNNVYGGYISVVGTSNTVSSSQSIVVGAGNTVSGGQNSVVGSGNVVVNNASATSVEGVNNKVYSPAYSHVGGSGNKMIENETHYAVFMHGVQNECRGSSGGAVFGAGNILKGNAQFVIGEYGAEDESKAFIVGGGTSDTSRKNIHTVDKIGNAYYAGDVTNGVGVSLNSLKSAVDNLSNIAAGGAIAKVFDTKADLDAWLAVEGNADTLVVGQSIYIEATGTADYWWDGTGLQILETDKVVIESMTYDETMAILNATAEGAA